MEALFYAAVALCIAGSISSENTVLTDESKMNLIEKLSTGFLKYVQWSKILILMDGQDFVYLSKHLSQHLISAKVARVDEFELNELNNFGSVLIISKPNTAIEIVKKSLKLTYCPFNWLLISEERLESFDNFFIPHDIALFLLDVKHSHEVWFLYRLYSANGNVIKTQNSGLWDPQNGAFKFSHFSVPLPLYSEKALRLTSLPFKPFFSIRKEKGQLIIGGVHGGILKTIQSVFLFNASVDLPKDRLFGNKINVSYASGMVGELYRNESDVGISLTTTYERTQFISYSPRISSVRVKLMYHNKDTAEKRFFFYLEPFSSYSWICINGFTILFAVLTSIISLIKSKAQRWPKKAIENIQIIYYYTRSALHILLKTGIPVQVYGLSGRICLFVFHIFCIVMFISYCSSLTSILALTRLKLPFNSFKDLLYNTEYDVATLKGCSIVQIMQFSKEDLYRKAYNKLTNKPEKLLVKSNKEGMDLVYNRKIAFIMEEFTMKALVGNNCSFRFLDEVILKTDFCFVFNKQFTYKQLFNKYIQLILENGVNAKLYIDYKLDDHNAYCDRMKKKVMAIKIPAVIGLFFTLYVGMGIALIVFITEMLSKILC